MRHATPLTPEQEKYITDNRLTMTLEDMVLPLGLKSVYKIRAFIKQFDPVKRELNDMQKDFVRKNYLGLKESEISSRLNTTRFFIQKFKREEGLVRKAGNRRKKAVLKEGFFNVHAKENWVA